MNNKVSWLTITLVIQSIIGSLAASGQPNIVFILADDLGWNALGCYGSELADTPNLDRLASEGIRFADAYALSQCLPTRAALFSGQYGARTRLTSVETASPDYAPMISPGRASGLPPETYTIFEMLRDAGYATGMSGKWHVADSYNALTLLQKIGIEYFEPYGLDFVGSSQSKTDEKSVMEITGDMLDFIEANRDGPFIAYLSHQTVHTPLSVPEKYTQKYVNRGFKRSSYKDGLFDERIVAEYLGMIDFLDHSVGAVMYKLDELGISENTVLVFASDNGGLTRVWKNEPLRGGKGQLYEGGVRIPMIIRWPNRIKAGIVESTPIHVVDLYPTFMEIAGGSVPADQVLDGVSLVPLVTGKSELSRPALFSHHPEYVVAFAKTPCSMIRKGDYKLIHYFGDYLDPEGCIPKARTLSGRFILGSKTELFDLRQDIGEQIDLSNSMPEKVLELMNDLEAWWADTDAQFPRPNPNMDRAQWIWNKDR